MHFLFFRQLSVALLLFFVGLQAEAQSTDSSRVDDDEDYGSAELAGGGSSKSYASARIVGTSPQRFISLAYDRQLGYEMNLSDWGEFADDSIPQYGRAERVKSTGGSVSMPVFPLYPATTLYGNWEAITGKVATNWRNPS